MILVNFSHPITETQITQIEAMSVSGAKIERKIEVEASFNLDQPFEPQARTIVDQVGLEPKEWSGLPLLVRLPSMSEIAAIVLVELHGRIGDYPTIVRMRKPAGGLVYEVVELIHLHDVRQRARSQR